MKKISSKKIISYLILLVLCFFAFSFIAKNTDLLGKLKQFSPSGALIISFFVILVFIFNGLRAKVLTEIFTKRPIKFTEWFGLSVINTVGNYSPFQGGMVARGYYLKNYYKVPYAKFVSSIVASTLITFSTYSVISSIVVIINYYVTGFFSVLAFLFFVLMGLGGFFGIFFLPKIDLSKYDNKFVNILRSFIDGWKVISHGKTVIPKLISIDIALAVIISTRFFTASSMIGAGLNFLQAIVISTMSMVALLVNITPGALGIREAIAGFSAQVMGSSIATGFTVASVERVMIIFWVFVIGIPFSYYFNHKVNKKLDTEKETEELNRELT